MNGQQRSAAAQRPGPFPANMIIIGAGIFGLSAALAIAERHPSTAVTVIDRLTPPVIDGSSVDTTRCIRSDYGDPIYAQLARDAQKKLEDDPDLSRHMFQQGMTFACDGEPSRFTELWQTQLKLAKTLNEPEEIVNMPSREAVVRRIHGDGAQLAPSDSLPGGKSRWNIAYCNLHNAFIDAEACTQVYYERCLEKPSIAFRCGVPVERICIKDGVSEGVILEDGSTIQAQLVVVAAGAWSNRLVYLEQRINPIAHEVTWIKVAPQEAERWKIMSITTNLSTGLNMFPPYKGEIKILRGSPEYKNTIRIPHPEEASKTIQISYPKTIVTNPTNVIPLNAEKEMRNNLREIMPSLAELPFDQTRLCWYVRFIMLHAPFIPSYLKLIRDTRLRICTTPTADFLLAPHPRIAGIHLATGGSAHAWKFLPVIGGLVVDSIEGVLSPELVEKWSYDKGTKGSDDNAP